MVEFLRLCHISFRVSIIFHISNFIYLFNLYIHFKKKEPNSVLFHVSTICLYLPPSFIAFASHLSLHHVVPSPLTSTSLSTPSKPNTVLMANSNTNPVDTIHSPSDIFLQNHPVFQFCVGKVILLKKIYVAHEN